MCEPLSIAGAVLTVASIAANQAAASKVAKAREGAMSAERLRQQGYDKEADALNTTSQDRYQDFGGQEAQKAQSLGDYFKAEAAPAETAPTEAPASSSNIIVQEQKKQSGKAQAYTGQQAEALGSLRAFGDLLGGISRDQARDASQIGVIGGFKRGSSEVLPFELAAANNKGNGLKTFADILGGLGTVASFGGAAGMGSAAGAASKAPTSLLPPGGIGSGSGGLASSFTSGGGGFGLPALY